MSIPAYPSYKKSGVEWLGDIPTHWSAGTLRWLAKRFSGGTPDKANLDYWANGTIPWINSGEVNQGLIVEPSTYITEEAYTNSSTKWVPAGALVMALAGQGKTKGMVAQVAVPMTCNQSMAAIVPNAEIASRFLYWWLSANYQNIRNMAGGDLRDGLNLDLLASISCPIPPPTEQSTIADFLDWETGKIDGLVTEQQRLIALLKEKRQAVISRAVTKGLNPAARMKDAGIEWLGEVPEHWAQKPLFAVVRERSQSNAGMLENNLLSLSYGTIIRKNINDNDGLLPASFETYQIVEPNDIVWRLTDLQNDKRSLRTAIARERGIITSAYLATEPTGILPEFLNYLLRAYDITKVFYSMGGGLRQSMKFSDVKWLPVTLPPCPEQSAIAVFLEREIGKIDTLVMEAETAIALLQERRAALISAAVTGKIDVRGFVAEAATENAVENIREAAYANL